MAGVSYVGFFNSEINRINEVFVTKVAFVMPFVKPFVVIDQLSQLSSEAGAGSFLGNKNLSQLQTPLTVLQGLGQFITCLDPELGFTSTSVGIPLWQ